MNKNLSVTIALLMILLQTAWCAASELNSGPFIGAINKENINVRADANTTSAIICQLNKNANVEIVSEKFDWYKIKLPKNAVCFIKKDLVETIDNKTAKVSRENVNLRLAPNESSPIIGKISLNEIVAILSDEGQWYKIKATDNSFGWVHKKFVTKSAPEIIISTKTEAPFVNASGSKDNIVLEGIIEPYGKVINRPATHKLITKDYDIYLLKGSPANLNTLTYHKVRITGKTIPAPKQKYPVIEIAKMEALD